MWLTRLSINRRVTIGMFIIGLVVMGLVGLSRMPWDLQPDIDFPMVSVTIPYPGAGPEEIEQQVIRPFEEAVSIISGVDQVSSAAQENIGSVMIRFDYGVDVDVAATDVRDALDRTQGLFPSDVQSPFIYKLDIRSIPVLIIGITGNRSPKDLRKLVEDVIKPAFSQVSGVAAVQITGGETREIQVLAHRERLEAYGISIAELSQQLRAQNLDMPSGSIKEGLTDYAIRVRGEFSTMDEMRALRIATPAGQVPLTALATVLDTVAETEAFARIDGNPGVGIYVLKQSKANTVQVADGIRRQMAVLLGDGETEGALPGDIGAIVAYDASERVRESIYDVRDALMYGALLAALVIFLFLHNFRGTIIVALAIPTCIIATFFPISVGFGFTLNIMVMLALALSVGILVDNSIVVLENIDRHLEMGEEPKAAAFNGRTEIGAATVATTCVDIVVYVPVALMGGIVGQFFFSFGITVFISTLTSLLMAFTLTPMLASWWYERRDKRIARAIRGFWGRFFAAFDVGYKRLETFYRAVLSRVIRRPFVTVGIGYGLLIATFVLIAPRMGFEFFPSSDAGRLDISIEMPVGTRIEETNRAALIVEEELRDSAKYPEIMNVEATVGQGAGGFFGVGDVGGRFAAMSVTMSRRSERVRLNQRSDQELAEDLRRAFVDFPTATIKITAASDFGGGGGADIEYQLLSEDLGRLEEAATKLAARLRDVPGLYYVDISAKPGRPEIHCNIDRLRAADLGITVSQIAMAARTAFEGSADSKFRDAGDEYDVRIQLHESDRRRIADVENLFVGTSPAGSPVYMRDVADVVISSGPSRIERYNRQRSITVSAFTSPDLTLGRAQALVEQAADEVRVPGVAYQWSGSVQMMGESLGYMGQSMLLAIILVYLVTAMLYNSVLEPLNVMLTLPMALVGAIVGLYIFGMSISMVAIIGFIMLMGLVGKNAILMVDYTNTLRGRGMSRTEALETAGPHRMQPVLMTSLATIMGMLPTALALNEGSEWRSPMAVAVIFGLAVATLLSLLVVPASYCIWDSVGNFFTRIGCWIGRAACARKNNNNTTEKAPPKE